MNNKLSGFTVPNNMNPKIEQINRENLPAEQSALSGVEGGSLQTVKIESEPTSVISNNKNQEVSENPTPQSYSAMQRESVTEQRGNLSSNSFGNLLDQKSGGDYSVDIRTVSNN